MTDSNKHTSDRPASEQPGEKQPGEKTSQKNWHAFIAEQNLPQHKDVQDPWMCELSQWDLLKLEGSDANSFLQGQISCDMNSVKGSQAQLAACINLKGRVIGNFIVCCVQQDQLYYLLCPPGSIDPVQQALKKYAIFSKVSIEVEQGELALAVLSQAAEANIEHCFQIPALKEHFVLAPIQTVKQLWESYAKQQKAFSASLFESRLIEQAVAFIGSALSETFTVQEINLDLVQGVSFNKGCYTGQEIVARLHYRGKAKRRVFIATLDTQEKTESWPEPGEQLLDAQNKEQGHLLQFQQETQQQSQQELIKALVSVNINIANDTQQNPELHFASSQLDILEIEPPPYPLE